MEIKSRLSPWHSSRGGAEVKYIILHTTAGSDAGDLSYMTDAKQNAKVSYHYLIQRDGSIWQLVPDSHKAWHAGKSDWGKDTDINPVSIGVAFSNKLDEYLTEDQYQSGGWLLAKLCDKHAVSFDRVLSHENISYPRKTDPWHTFVFGKLFGWAIAFIAPETFSKPRSL